MPPAVTLRPAQQDALAYSGGQMAVAAAPGSGKTFILTQLIVRLIGDLGARPDEILVLTFMRSAALTFRQRAAAELARRGKTARGLRALTIHAFCQGILRRELERYEALEDDPGGPGEAGRSVISESVRRAVLAAGVEAFLTSLEDSPNLQAALKTRSRADVLKEVVSTAIRAVSAAKQAERDPRAIVVPGAPEIGFVARYYDDHLQANSQLDFDDMIGRTVRLLVERPDILAEYQERIRYVLEDEAQDSTPLQNRLLEILSSHHGNLVRVGDPNQAILASFTSNDPRFFREFCSRVRTVPMSESSRSAPQILDLANFLVDVARSHPDPEIGQALGGDPIRPATAGPRNPEGAHLSWTAHPGKDKEITSVLTDVRQFMRDHPDRTCAILCASNNMIHDDSKGLAYLPAARAMGLDLATGDPDALDARALADVFDRALLVLDGQADDPLPAVMALAQARAAALGDPPGNLSSAHALKALRDVGIGLLVRPTHLRPARPSAVDESAYGAVVQTAGAIERLLPWRSRPASELLLAIAQELLAGRPGALLLAGRIAQLARRSTDLPDRVTGSQLAALRRALAEVSDETLSAMVYAAEPAQARPGQLAVLTVHKSKGAEYDAVWIPNIGYYHDGVSHFPWTRTEVRPRPAAELLAEQSARGIPISGDSPGPEEIQTAVRAHERAVIAERLRLLYVGITRAKRRLSLSCYALRGAQAPWHITQLASRIEDPQ